MVIPGILVSNQREVLSASIQVLIVDSARSSIHYIVILTGSHDTVILAVYFTLVLRDWDNSYPWLNHSSSLSYFVLYPLRAILIYLPSRLPFYNVPLCRSAIGRCYYALFLHLAPATRCPQRISLKLHLHCNYLAHCLYFLHPCL